MELDFRIAIIGLGYVGLPLAVEFANKFNVIGFDKDPNRIQELQNLTDITDEVSSTRLSLAQSRLQFTNTEKDISVCNVFIITVPTPVDKNNLPDCSFLEKASSTVGKFIKKNDIIIYESTVYPGATREICIPILEKQSGMELNRDFFVGYSPERINPGDKTRGLKDIVKVVSGSNNMAGKIINDIYSSIIEAGTHLVSSIEVAEAAKVIENTQRDLNIALANELSLIFNKIGIDTKEVIDAAGTKWNFAKFYPGFVGGHCIGVDPYYLTYKAQSIGYDPQVILSGRHLNDSMPSIVANRIKEQVMAIDSPTILILGYTFKENCPDVRNTKIKDLALSLSTFSQVNIYDPYIEKGASLIEYNNVQFIDEDFSDDKYDSIVVAVGHKEFIKIGATKLRKLLKASGKLWDLKSVFDLQDSDFRL